MGVAGASASGPASPAGQAVRMGRAGTSLAAASPCAQRWVKRDNGPGNAHDLASSVAVSPTTGRVFVTGADAGDHTTTAYQG